MQMPFMAVMLMVLAGAVASQGQSATSPTQLVHPVLKDPNNPSLLDDQNPKPTPSRRAACPAAPPAAPAEPSVITAKIDSGLVASKLAMIGTINGIKGTIYVTNLGAREVTPVVQVAVCDQKGFKVGAASKIGAALAPNADEKIVVFGTNLNATELKLTRLTSIGAK